MTKQEIMALMFSGHHLADQHIHNAVNTFVRDQSNSISDKAEVVEWLEVTVSGCKPFLHTVNEYQLVEEYLQMINDPNY